MRTWVAIVVPSAVIVVLAAVVLWRAGAFEAKPPPPPQPPPQPPTSLCPTTAASDEVRADNAYAGRAAPYAGPGPHPFVVLSGDADSGDTGLVYEQPMEFSPTSLPSPEDEERALQTQLIACRYGPARTGKVLPYTCDYRGRLDVPLQESVFTVVVYEARTAERVGEFTAVGTCPGTIEFDEAAPIEGILSSGAIEEGLRPYTEATVPG